MSARPSPPKVLKRKKRLSAAERREAEFEQVCEARRFHYNDARRIHPESRRVEDRVIFLQYVRPGLHLLQYIPVGCLRSGAECDDEQEGYRRRCSENLLFFHFLINYEL